MYGFQKELAHVIINLVANARDAYETNPKQIQDIKIGFYKKDKQTIISVIDHAGGIDPELIDLIFNPYFTTKEQGKGTGIGLYMSMRIVKEILHGILQVSNREDGACFSIILNDISKP